MAPPQYTCILGQCVEVITNFHLGNNWELQRTRVCATTSVCRAGNIPHCCCGAAVLVHAQSSNVRASLTSLRRVEPFSMIVPRAISVYWADAWIELRCSSAHTTGTIPPVVLETLFLKCHVCTWASLYSRPVLRSRRCIIIALWVLSCPPFKLYFQLCEPLCAFFCPFFLFVSMKTGRDTSCRYTPMYIGLLCCLALGDMSAFVILDNSVLKKTFQSEILLYKWHAC